MTMNPPLRKLTLTMHIIFTVGWIGAAAGFLALAITGLTGNEEQTVRAAYIGMEVTASYVIVPFAIASLITGLVISLSTQWGLFRHYWILFKLLITILATIVLLMQMDSISYLAGVAAEKALSGSDLRQARLSLVLHSGGGLLVLVVPLALSVYKPRGLTPYGWRKHHEQRKEPQQ